MNQLIKFVLISCLIFNIVICVRAKKDKAPTIVEEFDEDGEYEAAAQQMRSHPGYGQGGPPGQRKSGGPKGPKKSHPVFGDAGPPGHRRGSPPGHRPPPDERPPPPDEEQPRPETEPPLKKPPVKATLAPPPQQEATINPDTILYPKQGCKISVTQINGGQKVCSGDIIFEENFDQDLDKSRWKKAVQFIDAPDYEFVVYLSDAETLKIEDGNLKIKPNLLVQKYNDDDIINKELDLGTSCTGVRGTKECYRKAMNYVILPPIVSGRINTKGKFRFKYGKVEIRAKLPTGNWIYPELYLSPEELYYGENYASGLMRVAYMHGNAGDRKKINGGVVLGSNTEARTSFMKSYSVSHISSWAEDYHTFVLEWKPDVIELSVDGQVYGEVRPPPNGFSELGQTFKQEEAAKLWETGTGLAPFDKEFYLDIGVGVAGENFPDSPRKPWKNTSPKGMLDFWNKKSTWFTTWDENSELQVDYIKVTAL